MDRVLISSPWTIWKGGSRRLCIEDLGMRAGNQGVVGLYGSIISAVSRNVIRFEVTLGRRLIGGNR